MYAELTVNVSLATKRQNGTKHIIRMHVLCTAMACCLSENQPFKTIITNIMHVMGVIDCSQQRRWRPWAKCLQISRLFAKLPHAGTLLLNPQALVAQQHDTIIQRSISESLASLWSSAS